MRRRQALTTVALCGLLTAATLPTSLAAAEIATSPNEVRPLLVGAEMPDVTLKTIGGEATSVRELAAKQPTVLIFYRGGW